MKCRTPLILFAKNLSSAAIFREDLNVYEPNGICESALVSCMSNNERIDMFDEVQSGRPFAVSNELVQESEKVHEVRWFTITFFSHFSQICRIVFYKIGFLKFCARQISKFLSEEHRIHQMDSLALCRGRRIYSQNYDW